MCQRSNAMPFFWSGFPREFQHIRQGGRVEDSSGLISDLLHQKPDTTSPFIATIVALLIGRFAGAWQWSQWSLEHADNVAYRNLGGRSTENVAAALALLAAQHPVVFQLE